MHSMQIDVKLHAFQVPLAYLYVVENQPFQLAALGCGNLVVQQGPDQPLRSLHERLLG
jgi:hypothetical protein